LPVIKKEYLTLHTDVKNGYNDMPYEQLTSRLQMLFSMYWEEVSGVWRERMELLRRRDELTLKNERLIHTLNETQQATAELELEERTDRRACNEVRKEIEKERTRLLDERKTNDKRVAEIKRLQGLTNTVNGRIQKKRDELVNLHLKQGYRGQKY
jgi:chromosome segregation ATPase